MLETNNLDLLSVKQYDDNEEIGRQILEPSVTCFNWGASLGPDAGNFPTRVKDESELWKYVDSAQGEPVAVKVQRLGGLLPSEYDLFRKVMTETAGYAQAKFQKSIAAPSVFLGDLNLLRHLRYLYGNERPRVLEIGPGSGQLGAALSLEGYPYTSIEVTQAFYLNQSRFWSNLPGIKLVDLAQYDSRFAPPVNLCAEEGTMVHIPWFQFRWIAEAQNVGVDTVICERALCEMDDGSRSFYFGLTRKMLLADNNGRPKYFIYSNAGNTRNTTHGYLHGQFVRSGFVLVHRDKKITVYALQNTTESQGALTEKEYQISTVLRKAKDSFHFLWRIATGVHHPERFFVFRSFESSRPPRSGTPFFPIGRTEASRNIVDGRKNLSSRSIGEQEVCSFVLDLLGEEYTVGMRPQWLLKILGS